MRVLAALAVLLMLVAAVPALADNVTCGSGGTYSRLNTAFAAIADGDTVTIVGRATAAQAISPAGTILVIGDGEAGTYLTNSSADSGLVYVGGSGRHLTVRDLTFRTTTTWTGSTGKCFNTGTGGSELTIDNCEFLGITNTSGTETGLIVTSYSYRLVIKNSLMDSCSGEYGLVVPTGSEFMASYDFLFDNNIVTNFDMRGYGAIYMPGFGFACNDSTRISGNIFVNGRARDLGVVYLKPYGDGSLFLVDHNTFDSVECNDFDDGVLYYDPQTTPYVCAGVQTSATLSHNTFSNTDSTWTLASGTTDMIQFLDHNNSYNTGRDWFGAAADSSVTDTLHVDPEFTSTPDPPTAGTWVPEAEGVCEGTDEDYMGWVDCAVGGGPPDVPDMTAEPTYTISTSNTVAWSDESGSGATHYRAEYDEAADFASPTGIPWQVGLNKNFTGLSDGQIYYYHVKAKNAGGDSSAFSSHVNSTQDDTAPTSSASSINAHQNRLTFNVPYSASDSKSGVDFVKLYFQVDGGGYSQYGGEHESSPISFTASGNGDYDFYTRGTDNVVNTEAAPGSADQSTIIREVKSVHPRTLTTDMAALRTRCAGPFSTAYDGLKASLDDWYDGSFPMPVDTLYKYYPGKFADLAMGAAFLYQVEEDTTYAGHAYDMLKYIHQHIDTWAGDHTHTTWYSTPSGMRAYAMVYDWTYDSFATTRTGIDLQAFYEAKVESVLVYTDAYYILDTEGGTSFNDRSMVYKRPRAVVRPMLQALVLAGEGQNDDLAGAVLDTMYDFMFGDAKGLVTFWDDMFGDGAWYGYGSYQSGIVCEADFMDDGSHGWYWASRFWADAMNSAADTTIFADSDHLSNAAIFNSWTTGPARGTYSYLGLKYGHGGSHVRQNYGTWCYALYLLAVGDQEAKANYVVRHARETGPGTLDGFLEYDWYSEFYWNRAWQYLATFDDNLAYTTPDTATGGWGDSEYFDQNEIVIMRTGWDLDNTSTDVWAAFMGLGIIMDGTSHVLSGQGGHFQINRGNDLLAIYSGAYTSTASSHFKHWFNRSIAGNTVTVMQAGEDFDGGIYSGLANDGGQLPFWDATWSDYSDYGTVGDIAGGTHTGGVMSGYVDNADYVYTKVDLANLYRATKMDTITREWVWLKDADDDEAWFICFDKVRSDSAGQQKRWLLHMSDEPDTTDKNVQVDYDNSRMFVDMVYPSAHSLDLVGGSGYEFYYGGTNYPHGISDSDDYGDWRVEYSMSPSDSVQSQYFLTVMYVCDDAIGAMPGWTMYKEDGYIGVVIDADSDTFLFHKYGGAMVYGSAGEAPDRTRHDIGTSGHYATIALALADTLTVTAGDSLRLLAVPGTYECTNDDIDRALTIYGIDGTQILTPGDPSEHMLLASDELTLRDVIFRTLGNDFDVDQKATVYLTGSLVGNGVQWLNVDTSGEVSFHVINGADGFDRLQLMSCRVESCNWDPTGSEYAIRVHPNASGDVIFKDSVFNRNHGGGCLLFVGDPASGNADTLLIDGCLFTHNRAFDQGAGAVYFSAAGTATGGIYYSTFVDNEIPDIPTYGQVRFNSTSTTIHLDHTTISHSDSTDNYDDSAQGMPHYVDNCNSWDTANQVFEGGGTSETDLHKLVPLFNNWAVSPESGDYGARQESLRVCGDASYIGWELGPALGDTMVGAPTLVYPMDGAIWQPDDVTFTWGDAGADSYNLWVGTGACTTGGTIYYDIDATTKLVTGLDSEGDYKWSVRSISEGGTSGWGPCDAFTVRRTDSRVRSGYYLEDGGDADTLDVDGTVRALTWFDVLCVPTEGAADATASLDAAGGDLWVRVYSTRIDTTDADEPYASITSAITGAQLWLKDSGGARVENDGYTLVDMSNAAARDTVKTRLVSYLAAQYTSDEIPDVVWLDFLWDDPDWFDTLDAGVDTAYSTGLEWFLNHFTTDLTAETGWDGVEYIGAGPDSSAYTDGVAYERCPNVWQAIGETDPRPYSVAAADWLDVLLGGEVDFYRGIKWGQDNHDGAMALYYEHSVAQPGWQEGRSTAVETLKVRVIELTTMALTFTDDAVVFDNWCYVDSLLVEQRDGWDIEPWLHLHSGVFQGGMPVGYADTLNADYGGAVIWGSAYADSMAWLRTLTIDLVPHVGWTYENHTYQENHDGQINDARDGIAASAGWLVDDGGDTIQIVGSGCPVPLDCDIYINHMTPEMADSMARIVGDAYYVVGAFRDTAPSGIFLDFYHDQIYGYTLDGDPDDWTSEGATNALWADSLAVSFDKLRDQLDDHVGEGSKGWHPDTLRVWGNGFCADTGPGEVQELFPGEFNWGTAGGSNIYGDWAHPTWGYKVKRDAREYSNAPPIIYPKDGGSPGDGIVGWSEVLSVAFYGAFSGNSTYSDTAEAYIIDNTLYNVESPLASVLGAIHSAAATIPTMSAEPTYTQGTENLIAWSDESVSGATAYMYHYDTDSGFASPDSSAWLAKTNDTVTGLSDAQIYYYRVKARNSDEDETGWSNTVSSTQDDTAPTSSVDALDAFTTNPPISVAYTDGDAVSGVDTVRLFYDYESAGWVQYEDGFTSSPISFSLTDGEGEYEFYTRAIDVVENYEAAPGSADASTVADTTAPTSEVSGLPGTQDNTTFDVPYIDNDATSGVDYVKLYYQFDGGGFSQYGDTHGSSPISFTSSDGDGVYGFYTRATDNAALVEDAPGSADESTTLTEGGVGGDAGDPPAGHKPHKISDSAIAGHKSGAK